mgnify:CR=1 FL=1
MTNKTERQRLVASRRYKDCPACIRCAQRIGEVPCRQQKLQRFRATVTASLLPLTSTQRTPARSVEPFQNTDTGLTVTRAGCPSVTIAQCNGQMGIFARHAHATSNILSSMTNHPVPDLDVFLLSFGDNFDIWFQYGPGDTQNFFEALLERYLAVLDVALARGQKLGYMDDDYRKTWRLLTGNDWDEDA